MTPETIEAAIKRIDDYKAHDYCDSELDAVFDAELAVIDVLNTLLHNPQNAGALTDKGRLVAEDLLETSINNADDVAKNHGLTDNDEEE